MQLSADTRAGVNVVLGYSPAEVRLRERVLRASAIVTAQRVEPWPVARVADLTRGLLDRVLELDPQVVLLATGARQQFPDPELYAYVQSRGVGFEVMEVGAACRTYNVLVGEDRRVALALVVEGA
jgi:uncharacterized protein